MLSEETRRVRSGLHAARITATVANSYMSVTPTVDPVQPPGTAMYCASAWAHGQDAGTFLQLNIREWRGTTVISEKGDQQLVPPDWTLLRTSYVSSNQERLDMRVGHPLTQLGDYFLVDDAKLWRSVDGGCGEP